MPYAAGGAGSASAGGAWQHKLQSKLPPQQQLQQQGGVSGSGVNSSLQAGVQQQQPVPPPRPGTRPVGNFLEAPRAKIGAAALRLTESGVVLYESSKGAPPRRLQLVRGLRNGEGEYNCFLNVIIQSLWHLRPFRESLLRLKPPPVPLPSSTHAAAQGGNSSGGAPAAPQQHQAASNGPSKPQAEGAPSTGGGDVDADSAVLRALCNIFHALAAPPAEAEGLPAGAAAEEPQQQQKGGKAGRASNANVSLRRSLAVSPWELREALDALGQGPARIQKSEMHDASEVLGEILNCLHRAEARARAAASPSNSGKDLPDITLPQRIKLPPPLPQTTAAPAANGGSPSKWVAAAAAGTAAGSAPAAAAVAAGHPALMSTVHQLVGLDVQVPCPPSDSSSKDEEEEAARKGGRSRRTAAQAAAQAKENSASASAQAAANSSSGSGAAGSGGGSASANWRSGGGAAAGAAGAHASGSSSSSSSAGPQQAEVLQFTKFFHLVPAQGLRRAYSQASSSPGQPPASWESLLMTLEAASNSPCSSNNSSSGQLQMHKAATTLLRTPRIFMLALVWESPQVAPDAIHGTLSALGPELDLLAAFKVPPKAAASSAAAAAPSHSLRAAVCYVGHHYLAFVLAEELGLWLCFDDADISLVGQWADVCRAMLNRRMQPLLLLYEDKASQQQQGPGAAAAAPAAAAPAAALPASHPAPVASRA